MKIANLEYGLVKNIDELMRVQKNRADILRGNLAEADTSVAWVKETLEAQAFECQGILGALADAEIDFEGKEKMEGRLDED